MDKFTWSDSLVEALEAEVERHQAVLDAASVRYAHLQGERDGLREALEYMLANAHHNIQLARNGKPRCSACGQIFDDDGELWHDKNCLFAKAKAALAAGDGEKSTTVIEPGMPPRSKSQKRRLAVQGKEEGE